MIGGGQLARMTHQAAIALGQTLRVLAAGPDDPAAQVTPDVVIGAHTDLDALRRAAAGADAVTFDHEHVPTELLDKLVADGVNVAPPPQALIHAQDKLVMRRRLEALGAPIPRYAAVTEVADVDAFAARIGGPVVVKTVRGGYDGRGVTLARDLAEARDVAGRYLADGVAVLVEERVAMRRELSALVARSPFGQGAAWPVVETVQRDGICVEVIAPAQGLERGDRQRRGRARAFAWPPTSASSACWPWSCSRPSTARCWSTSWRCGRTIPVTGRWTAPEPASSSSTCGPCWTIRSATRPPLRR